MSEKLLRLLKTAVALAEQFQATIDTTTPQATTQTAPSASLTDPLRLLSDSTKALRSQVTKLSLLSITAPFTPSAISTVVGVVNDSVMPSLVTAALLLTPSEYTKAFSSEARILSKTVLREFASLVEDVIRLAEKKKREEEASEELSKAEKDVVTSRTGRVWDACDTLLDLVEKGIVGFVAGRVQQWHDLVKDAISELEEWDPEDDTDFNELLDSDDEGDDDESENGQEQIPDEKENMDRLQDQKKSTLRAMKPLVQIYPAIISNRIKKGGLAASKSQIQKLESLSADLQAIPDHIDEAAGSLYEGNVADSIRYLRLAKTSAERAVQSVALPWKSEDGNGDQSPEDKFTTWSRTWMKVISDVINDV
ncbi:hypothetical protein BGW36DRAFT_389645 [Talaromyces proteolyticus]|uniref:Cyclin-D1-binding protein 1-like N-terminal domain-containing protein n=1 Tax=Talaromyces proteolyticus TaxID=1131652 RepID=A0AAD4KLP0_9EURO|nr:uncharacterized protein BGW36DRAFT_389645 [Talaromyces proteolyticus]KAH8690946.1 hypothetical protein BGW36DRAFT_389645 [Talaromyces proteolyticus]